MRILLHIIFLFFKALIIIEDATRSLFSFCKAMIQRLGRVSFLKRFTRLTKQKHRKKKRKDTLHTLFPLRNKLKYFFLGVFFSCFFLFFPLVFLLFLQDLPSPRELSIKQVPQTTKIFDRNGVLLSEIYANQNRTLVSLHDIPKSLQNATLAIEDKNFYQHPGFDVPGIIRALQADLAGRKIQGGSTITQQLIKSSMLTPEQSITRKIKEVVLAFWAERIYSKQQILEMYFNQVPYGGTAWGIEAASETYFDKPVKNLSLAQSAFLAGLTSAPTAYSPYGNNPNAWKSRQKEVLTRMVALHYISHKESDKAMKEKLVFKRQQNALHAPHFVNYIKELLIKNYGISTVEKGGLTIRTSLDVNAQEMAEKVVKEEVANDQDLNLSNGAAVITNPKNGDILAMVGSHDFDDPNGGNVNIATSLRQPGSSIKVITYSAALMKGFTAASILDDSPVSYPSDSGTYSPVNYDGGYHGRVPVRIALANSLNIPAVKLLDQIGIDNMISLAKAMGITSYGDAKDYGLSVTLGSGEVTMLDMASVYGTLANNGQKEEINPILKITDATGAIIEEKTKTHGTQVLSPGVSFIISNILADNAARSMEFGPNSPLLIPDHTVSVKTGTTDNKRDNWTDGYTNDFVVIVWVGNNDNTPMSQTLASGITGAAPIWHGIMSNLLKSHPETKPTPPSTVVQQNCYGKPEYFVKGTESSVNCGSPQASSSAYSFK